MNILLLDDEKAIHDLINIYLTKHIIYNAYDAKTAQQIIDNNQIDLIISDYMMPETNGINFINENRHIPAILISGYMSPQNIPEGVCFLSKPFDPNELLKIIDYCTTNC